jgi:hypothetical protein
LVSYTQLWAGRIVSGFAVLFFLMDGVMKLMKPDVVVKATVQELGYPESEIVGIGVLLLACIVVRHSPHLDPGSNPADRIPRRRHRQQDPHRRTVVRHRLYRCIRVPGVGRFVAARRPRPKSPLTMGAVSPPSIRFHRFPEAGGPPTNRLVLGDGCPHSCTVSWASA